MAFDPGNSMLLMTDIMPEGQTLLTLLESGLITNEMMVALGITIGEIHQKLQDTDMPIREDGDAACYEANLFYKYGYHNHPSLNSMITNLKGKRRQLILGDLSPKNIGIDDKNQITICDFENTHLGNTTYDVGFLLAHIILHNLSNPLRAQSLVVSFLGGYCSNTSILLGDLDLKRLVIGTLLYRTNNGFIPYPLDISPESRDKLNQRLFQLLDLEDLSWDQIFTVLN